MLSCKPPCRLIRKNLADCLKGIGKNAGVLTVLKPLLLSGGKKDRAKLPELVPQWEEEIRSAGLPEHETEEAAELLICAVMERFSVATLEADADGDFKIGLPEAVYILRKLSGLM